MNRVAFASAQEVASGIPRVIAHLRASGLIAYPTETVYGFGCLIRDDALLTLAALKSRDESKPFLLLIEDAARIPALIWTPAARKLADAFWPGPLTLALRVRENFPSGILSEEGTVAVRATPHTGIRSLLQALGEPITSTSANTPGHAPAESADDVEGILRAIGGEDVMILDGGRLPHSAPSTLVDCSTDPPRVVRAGAITTEALEQVVDLA